jgi:Zn-dependent peptidase ImmA (M78 family)
MYDLSNYSLSPYESWINSKYQEVGIHNASDLELDLVASCFNGEIRSTKYLSHVMWDDDYDYFVIFLNSDLKEIERRYQFFHELAHPLLHIAKQTDEVSELLVRYQEEQAQHFQLYAALPLYMIEKYKYDHSSCFTKLLSEEFKLPEHLVSNRIYQIKNRIQKEMYSAKIKRDVKEFEERKYPKSWTIQIKGAIVNG